MFFNTFKNLNKSRDFKVLVVAYGINMGVIMTIFTLINTLVLYYIRDSEKKSGLIAATIIVSCLFTALLMILILRHQRNLKLMAMVTTGMALVSVLFFFVGLTLSIMNVIYLSAIGIGMSLIAFQTTGYEFAFESTFPVSTVTVTSVMNISGHVVGIILIQVVTTVYSRTSYFFGNLIYIGLLLVSLLLLGFAKSEMKRTEAYKQIESRRQSLATESTPLVQSAN